MSGQDLKNQEYSAAEFKTAVVNPRQRARLVLDSSIFVDLKLVIVNSFRRDDYQGDESSTA